MARGSRHTRPGELSRSLCWILHGSWRPQPPPLSGDSAANEARLAAVSHALMESGAGGLGWWRIRETRLAQSATGHDWQQLFRSQTLNAALRERDIAAVFAQLRAAGVEPLLIKGWASAQAYPAKGLRVFGDIDLHVWPHQARLAAQTLGIPVDSASEIHDVDLKSRFPSWYGRSTEAVFERSVLKPLGEAQIRVPSPEDHLRILCIHFLRHGAWRPSWLCDIAAALEAWPANFDWDECLTLHHPDSLSPRRADWILCTLGLAQQLIGASAQGLPPASRPLPRWLKPAVLQQWMRPAPEAHAPFELMRHTLLRPLEIPRAVLNRWPNPIAATIELQAPLNAMPRAPLQLLHYLRGGTHFLRRRGRSLD